MRRIERILCATDLSEPADEAIRQAAAIAAASGARLTFVRVITTWYGDGGGAPMIPLAPGVGTEELERFAATEVRAQVARAAPAAAGAEVRIEAGYAYAGILTCADDLKADLVVVGSRGSTGLRRMALGSVAEKVVRYAACPVLVARSSPASGQVLAATDLSEPSLAAVEAAYAEAQRRRARLTVVHCMEFPPPMMTLGAAPLVPLPEEDPGSRVARSKASEARLREALARLRVQADVVIDPGRATSAIQELAERLPAELVVVGTRGSTGLRRMLLGSTSESVVRHAPCSVLALRPTATTGST